MGGIEAAFFGALARDAESKVSEVGKPYVRFTVRIGDGDGVQWVSVLAFDPTAIEAVDKLVAGGRVYVEGTLSAGKYTGKDGTERLGLTVMSWHTRLSGIGPNKTKRDVERPRIAAAAQRQDKVRSLVEPTFNDDVPF